MQILNQETVMEKVGTLIRHPKNVNQGDVGAIIESVDTNGWWGSVIAQKGTRHILIGNHRWMAAQQLGAEEIPVTWVDVDQATDRESWARLMAGQRATMCVTDPPWNVAIGKDSNPRHRQREGLENDDLSPEEFQAFLKGFAANLLEHVEGDLYCCLGASEWPTLDRTLRNLGFHWSATIIWVKDMFVLGRSKYHRRYEPFWYGWHKKGKSSYVGERDQDDVWEFDRPRVSDLHPTIKPLELFSKAIENSSRIGQIVVEPFLGSGTTLIASEQLGRICYGIDKDPKYVAVTLERASEMGLEIRRSNDG